MSSEKVDAEEEGKNVEVEAVPETEIPPEPAVPAQEEPAAPQEEPVAVVEAPQEDLLSEIIDTMSIVGVETDDGQQPTTEYYDEPETGGMEETETMSTQMPTEEEHPHGTGRSSSIKSHMSHVSHERTSMLSEFSKLGEEEEDNIPILGDEGHHDSMFTQAGSYATSTSSEGVSEGDTPTMPRTFQDYVKKYSTIFQQISGQEESPCDEEAGKTFLKIDLNEIMTGYKTDDKICTDVNSSILGMTRVRSHLVCIENEPIILRKDYKDIKGVRILSGGHMGYEPLYIDYVGKGLLTGVVLGSLSDPPSVASVTKAMRELAHGSSGLLILIQNNVEYRLIFGLAMERIRMEGFIDIDMVPVGDDSYERCKSPVGRRGLAGIVLLFKLAGSMADCQKTLREIYVAVRSASKSLVTISCMTKPFKAVGTGLDKNSKDGIHFNGDNSQMIKRMIDYCVHPMRYFSLRFDPEDKVILLINNYRTTNPEFFIVVDYIVQELERRKVTVERVYADHFVTGFWPGFSITLMIDCNACRAFYMDAPSSSSLWPRTPPDGRKRAQPLSNQKSISFPEMGPMLSRTEAKMTRNALVTACKAIILCESVLNALHFFGNYGTKLRLGAEALMQAERQSRLNFYRPFSLMIEISEILIEKLPGVIGAMYGCLFEGAARSFVRSPLTTVTSQNWSEAMDEALKTLRAYTNAKGGIVSLALSLIPVVSAIHGPYLRLINKSNRNPILIALDSLRAEIEERLRHSSDEKESLLKNQLDVESYALIIWLHAVYSSVYWKAADSSASLSLSEEQIAERSQIERETRNKSQTSKSSRRSNRISSLKGINKSLEFIASGDPFERDSIPAELPGEEQSITSRSSKSGKIFA